MRQAKRTSTVQIAALEWGGTRAGAGGTKASGGKLVNGVLVGLLKQHWNATAKIIDAGHQSQQDSQHTFKQWPRYAGTLR